MQAAIQHRLKRRVLTVALLYAMTLPAFAGVNAAGRLRATTLKIVPTGQTLHHGSSDALLSGASVMSAIGPCDIEPAMAAQMLTSAPERTFDAPSATPITPSATRMEVA